MSCKLLPTPAQLSEHKASAVAWALMFAPLCVPSDPTTADATIAVRPKRREVMDAIAPLSWIEWEYTVYLLEGWAVASMLGVIQWVSRTG
jgi:hypothetical protein